MLSQWLAVLSVAVVAASGATRPHYGGALRVEVRESIETADPPQTGAGMADLASAFVITRWEGGRLAVYSANNNAAGGRPFLDSVEIQMARPLREQAIDLELGKADIVELGIDELRRTSAGRRTWTSAPIRLVALVFGPRVTDPRVREALALAVDRAAMHNVLLQRQGEISGALLPQWISGYAFLFPAASDIAKARSLTGGLPAQARALGLGFEDAAWRPVAERIALNARDAGLAVSVSAQNANPDVRLVEVRIVSAEPARALSGVAAALGLTEPPHADSADGLLAAERALLDGFRIIPLFHLPAIYGVSQRVKGGPGITRLGEWRFEDLWVEGKRP
jgi:peptide/nickel transport system substrate-binding protein